MSLAGSELVERDFSVHSCSSRFSWSSTSTSLQLQQLSPGLTPQQGKISNLTKTEKNALKNQPHSRILAGRLAFFKRFYSAEFVI